MSTFKKTLSSSLAALTMVSALLASSASAEARGGRGAAVAAGVIGGLALGAIAVQAAQPRAVYVVHRRAHRHHCGCVHHVRYYY